MTPVQKHYIDVSEGIEYFEQEHLTHTSRCLSKQEILSLKMCIDMITKMIEDGYMPILESSGKSSGKSSVLIFKKNK